MSLRHIPRPRLGHDVVNGVEAARVQASVAALLRYPDEQLVSDLTVLSAATAQISQPAGGLLEKFVEYLRSTPLEELESTYVDTFDLRRRCCLYLTYYGYGDTRKRGAALVRFTHAYRTAGLPPPEAELADHLGVVCNFAALVPSAGADLLQEHRGAVELIYRALADLGSPYTNVVGALRTVLPEISGPELSKALDLARTGPPAEEVGPEPFGPPEYMGGRP